MKKTYAPDDLLTPREVAAIFRVDPKTVSCWVRAGRVMSVRTPGGHHRLKYKDVVAAFNETNETKPEATS